MRKQSVYDFEKLFMGHNLKKNGAAAKDPPSREATAQRERAKQVNNYVRATKPQGINLHIKTSSTVSSVSSKGSSAEKTSRKPSVGNIHLIMQKGEGQKTRGESSRNYDYSREEVENFYKGLGVSTTVKYVPVTINTEKKSVKRDLTNLLAGLSLTQTSPEQTVILTKKQGLLTQRSQSTQQKQNKIISKELKQLKQSVRQPRKLTHKQSFASLASNCSSRYGSVSQSSSSNLKNIQEKFKQSEEKINKLRDRLSQLYSLKTESSQKIIVSKPKCRLTRYDSILLR